MCCMGSTWVIMSMSILISSGNSSRASIVDCSPHPAIRERISITLFEKYGLRLEQLTWQALIVQVLSPMIVILMGD